MGPSRFTSKAHRASIRQVFDLGVPILGICYGAQLIAHQLGGIVDRNDRGEYGRTTLAGTVMAADCSPRCPRSGRCG